MNDSTRAALERELAYHERLYAGFAQQHFARPAVRALREHMVRRILKVTGVGRRARVLSLGCGIGDTELLLAPHVGEVVGVDLSPRAVAQAQDDARRREVRNARFVEGSLDVGLGEFDAVVAIFFLHHLPDDLLDDAPRLIRDHLAGGGVFYSLDPSRRRLSGRVGRLLVPKLMEKYQTPDERELDPEDTAGRFRLAGFDVRSDYYDFLSSPWAGLFPGWRAGYQLMRAVDEGLLRVPGVRRYGSNFEVIARVRPSP